MSEWLDKLKVGDEVVVSSGYYGFRLDKVSRLTKTWIIISNQSFWRNNGYQVKSSTDYMRTRITEPTNAMRLKIRRDWLVRKMQNFKWQTTAIEILEDVDAVLRQTETPNVPGRDAET
jgi:hypothetical protein